MKTETARGRGRPVADTQRDTRRDILQAAIGLFGERGFDGVSLNQIVRVAGVDIGLIRYYFGSKIGLWKAAVDHIAEQLSHGPEPQDPTGDLSETERLKSAIRWFVGISAEWPQISRMIVFDGNDDGERGSYIAEKWVRPFYSKMDTLIEGAKAEGSLPDVSNRTMFFLIAHGSSFPMALPSLTNKFPGGDITCATALQNHADAIIRSLFEA